MSDVEQEPPDAAPETQRRALPPAHPEKANGSAPAAPPAAKNGAVTRKRVLIVGLIVAIVAGAAAFVWYLNARHYESTDDAFFDAHIVQISPRIDGHVLKVLVNDNQAVKAGDVLVELDPATLDNEVAQAKANLDAAEAQANQAKTNVALVGKTAPAARAQGQAVLNAAQAAVDASQAAVAQAQAQVTADQASAHMADLTLARYQRLLETGDVTRQQVDAAVADQAAANARLAASRKAVASAQAQVEEAKARVIEAQGQFQEADVVAERTAVSKSQMASADAQIEQLQTAYDQAKLNRTYAEIVAPEDGRVTRRNVERGQYVEKGQVMMAIVPRQLYITANFKETQLTNMKPGQKVTISVDAYPGATLHGHVDSLQHGSGALFSLLPPENATGNFVKVVQRVPVKIVLDEPLNPKRDYAPGMSVEPKVRVR